MLGDQQRESLVLIIDAIAALCVPVQDVGKIPLLKEQVGVALARHVPKGIERFGSVHATWMFTYEKFNFWLCRRALNRRHPAANILRTYQVIVWVKFELKNPMGYHSTYPHLLFPPCSPNIQA